MTKTHFASTRLRCLSSRGLSSKASLSVHWWQGGHGGVWGVEVAPRHHECVYICYDPPHIKTVTHGRRPSGARERSNRGDDRGARGEARCVPTDIAQCIAV